MVAWFGNYVPYKYDLANFMVINAVSFDHAVCLLRFCFLKYFVYTMSRGGKNRRAREHRSQVKQLLEIRLNEDLLLNI